MKCRFLSLVLLCAVFSPFALAAKVTIDEIPAGVGALEFDPETQKTYFTPGNPKFDITTDREWALWKNKKISPAYGTPTVFATLENVGRDNEPIDKAIIVSAANVASSNIENHPLMKACVKSGDETHMAQSCVFNKDSYTICLELYCTEMADTKKISQVWRTFKSKQLPVYRADIACQTITPEFCNEVVSAFQREVRNARNESRDFLKGFPTQTPDELTYDSFRTYIEKFEANPPRGHVALFNKIFEMSMDDFLNNSTAFNSVLEVQKKNFASSISEIYNFLNAKWSGDPHYGKFIVSSSDLKANRKVMNEKQNFNLAMILPRCLKIYPAKSATSSSSSGTSSSRDM